MIFYCLIVSCRANIQKSTTKTTVIGACIRCQSIDSSGCMALCGCYFGRRTNQRIQSACLGIRSGHVNSKRYNHFDWKQTGMLCRHTDAWKSIQNESARILEWWRRSHVKVSNNLNFKHTFNSN